jgi:hypothetical protein
MPSGKVFPGPQDAVSGRGPIPLWVYDQVEEDRVEEDKVEATELKKTKLKTDRVEDRQS